MEAWRERRREKARERENKAWSEREERKLSME